MGIEQADLIDGFRTFAGVKRRQEIRGEQRGILVFDDFAHHPTAVRETIEAIRAAYQGRRIWAVFEPRSNTSKRNLFEHEFAAALALADRVLIAPVYQPEKIPDGERLSVDRVVSGINRLGGDGRARKAENAANIAHVIAREARPGDIALVMSNGGFDNVHERILEALTV
jgi:UDP-N-acetylmuramate: L-alanyl-gamma-D-glutamyl-meso-diaminopimelate ligase